MKTGFTKKSGRCLVSAARKDGVTLIAVTLNGGDYWNDHIALYEYGFSRVKSVTLTVPNATELAVCGGVSERVVLQMDRPPAVTLLNEEAARVRMIVELPRFVWAPVDVGDIVGRVRYCVDDRELASLSITAATAVKARPVASYGQRFWRYLGALLACLGAGT